MSSKFQKFSGVCGILAGIAGLAYLGAFLALKNPAALAPSLALLAVGILASPAIVGVYQRVRMVDEGFALVGAFFGVGGALGAAVHAAFDLSNSLHPPATVFAYPNPVDPRGFLTFAIAGLAAILLSWLIVTGEVLPRMVGYLGILSGVLLVGLFIAYLVLLNASNPLVLGLVLVTGILQPLWYLGLGWSLLQAKRSVASRMTSS